MENQNMRIYDKLRQPPKDALKEITAGRLKGKSDINPQWRYEAMTEVFGPCGIGWYYTIEKLWSEEATNGEKFAFANILLYIKDGNEWSMGIPGTGGSKLIEQERAGLHVSDEGYKMAVTDALSVACKFIGVGADVYRGRWDGTKYNNSGTDLPTGGAKNTPSNPPKDIASTLNEYKEAAEQMDKKIRESSDKPAEPTTDQMRKEMTDWFIKQYGADAMIEFDKMTNGTFKDPMAIKTPKNVTICYRHYLKMKEGVENAKH